MANVEKLVQLGKELGHEGQALQAFVTAQQNEEREERRRAREIESKRHDENAAKREHEIEVERLKTEHEANLEKIRLDAKEKEARIAAELERIKVELDEKRVQLEREKLESSKTNSFMKSKLPQFNEEKDKFDAYISRFESYAHLRKWPKTEWAMQLSILLTGKALDTYYGLSSEAQKSYEEVKEALLRRYDFTEDEFRRQFFSAKAESGETPSQFMVRLERVLSRWVQTAKIELSFEDLCCLLVREQFIRKCQPELAAYLREKKFKDPREVAKATELYLDAHGGTMYEVKGAKKKGNVIGSKNMSLKKNEHESVSVSGSGTGSSDQNVCRYCRKAGHDISECKKLKEKGNRKCYICESPDHIATDCPQRKVSAGFLSAAGVGVSSTESICLRHGVPVVEGFVNGHKVKVMRDKGSTMVVVNSSLVSSSQFLGREVQCSLVDGTLHSYPVAKIHVDCPYLKGYVEAAVMKSPLFDLVVGNVPVLDSKGPRISGRVDFDMSIQSAGKAEVVSPVSGAGISDFPVDAAGSSVSPVDVAGHVFPSVEVTDYSSSVEVTDKDVPVESAGYFDVSTGNSDVPVVLDCDKSRSISLAESVNFMVDVSPEDDSRSMLHGNDVTSLVDRLILPAGDVGTVSLPAEEDILVDGVPLPVHDTGDVLLTPEVGADVRAEGGHVDFSDVSDTRVVPSEEVVYGKVAGNRDIVKETSVSISATGPVTIKCVAPRNLHLDEIQMHFKSVVEAADGVMAAVTRLQSKSKSISPLIVPSQDVVDPKELVKLQETDDTLVSYWQNAQQDLVKENKNAIVKFVVKGGILHRVFEKKDGSSRVTQLIVPVTCRKKVLEMAHDGLMSGHRGIRRTYERVVSNFYWPGVRDDVTRYCRSCDRCQKTVPKGRTGKAPLQRMPIVKIPFQRVAVDLVGPIVPCSERGHRYILTVVDYATRYPEAVALKRIDTISVAEGLIDIFSRVGFPVEVLSDRGSQFVSEIMQEVSRLLSMKQLFTSPYHPMCNGLVEKWNGTLKSILKRLCAETPKQWDRYLPAVLFAYHSTVQETTGYSPFELLMGRKVRGPMEILRDFWSNNECEDEVKTVYKYVVDLKKRLLETCKIAQEEIMKSQELQKVYYDKKARPRKLKVGSRVLLLLPMKQNKLLLQWRGPYKVIEKTSPVNYIIEVHGKHKVFHVNMLKEYVERSSMDKAISCAMILKDGDSEGNDELIELISMGKELNSQGIDISESLTGEQKREVQSLLKKYDKVITNTPGRTSVETHAIKLVSSEPVRVKPYPIPYALRETIKKEVDEMLKLGVIRESKSPYTSPPVIVVKPDATNRFCVNYKKLNSQTVFDGEPMPNPEDIFIAMRGKKYKSKMDLSKGYWQIQMAPDSIEKTAFTTPDGVFEFLRMPFGLKNSAASFNRLMRKVLGGMENVGCFVDDVIIFTDTWEQHVKVLENVFCKLQDAGLTVKPSKCQIGYDRIEFLGHVVAGDTLAPRTEKVSEILAVDKPKTKRQVKSFLAMAGYYGKFISRFSDLAFPLTELTKKGHPNQVEWTKLHDNAFESIKSQLGQSPILKIIDLDKVMYVQTDASEVGIGCALLQEYSGYLHPVRYHCRKLKKAEQNYSTIEKECLAIVWAIEKLKVFLYGREFVLLTDNKPLVFLKESNMKNARVMRWSLFLQDWSFRIQSIRGVDNHVADYLSRS